MSTHAHRQNKRRLIAFFGESLSSLGIVGFAGNVVGWFMGFFPFATVIWFIGMIAVGAILSGFLSDRAFEQ